MAARARAARGRAAAGEDGFAKDVPLILGQKTVLPYRRKLRYPSETVVRAIDEALPRLATLRRNLPGTRRGPPPI